MTLRELADSEDSPYTDLAVERDQMRRLRYDPAYCELCRRQSETTCKICSRRRIDE